MFFGRGGANTLYSREIVAVQSAKPSQKYKKLINMFLLRLSKNTKISPNISPIIPHSLQSLKSSSVYAL